MKYLLIMRGAMGSGKSTFIHNNGLEPYTLSSDDIRNIFGSPVLSTNNRIGITQENESTVWKFLMERLEDKMKNGEFIVIDATHKKSSMLSKYKNLCQQYGYRAGILDLSGISLETCLERNRERDDWKYVPEMEVKKAHIQIQNEPIQKWFDIIKPNEISNLLNFPIEDLTNDFKKILFIGDIHGCYDVLVENVNFDNEDTLYIFTGDYLDRGIQNKEVLEFIMSLSNRQNVIFLKGNHAKWLEYYASKENNDIIEKMYNRYYNELPKKTKEERQLAKIEDCLRDILREIHNKIDKKAIRIFMRNLRQMLHFKFDGKEFLVSHGGLPSIPKNTILIPTKQYISGVGKYSDDIDDLWNKNTNDNQWQVHGHRNIYLKPTINDRSINLEGKVEFGGNLRTALFIRGEQYPQSFEYKNNTYDKDRKQKSLFSYTDPKNNKIDIEISNEEFINNLKNHKYIIEKQQGNNISSFNFSKGAFRKKMWDSINSKARGLFVNTKNNQIISRGYDKFFNINERSFTKIQTLPHILKFPISIYEKANGYLGLLGYDCMQDKLIFSSKSTISGDHAQWFKDIFMNHCYSNSIDIDEIKNYLKDNRVSLTFEIIDMLNDPHIIDYGKTQDIVLLDIIDCSINFSFKENYINNRLPLTSFAKKYNFKIPNKVCDINSFNDFYEWYVSVKNDYSIKEEGYVVRDSENFMLKIKLPYYNFWKLLRSVKDQVFKYREKYIKDDNSLRSSLIQNINTSKLFLPIANEFFAWLKNIKLEDFQNRDIITLRNEFLKSYDEIYK